MYLSFNLRGTQSCLATIKMISIHEAVSVLQYNDRKADTFVRSQDDKVTVGAMILRLTTENEAVMKERAIGPLTFSPGIHAHHYGSIPPRDECVPSRQSRPKIASTSKLGSVALLGVVRLCAQYD